MLYLIKIKLGTVSTGSGGQCWVLPLIRVFYRSYPHWMHCKMSIVAEETTLLEAFINALTSES